jgi:hypothetical protein
MNNALYERDATCCLCFNIKTGLILLGVCYVLSLIPLIILLLFIGGWIIIVGGMAAVVPSGGAL